jgi:ABC-2 type transport system ATP-binding protein
MGAAIEIAGLSKVFRPVLPRLRRAVGARFVEAVTALDGVDLRIDEGEIFGLIGRNGAGKTTLSKILATLIIPTSGTARVLGLDVTSDEVAVRRRLALVTSDERSFYWRLTGWQNLLFFARLLGLPGTRARHRIGELLDLFGVADIAHRRFAEYSTGNRQRFALARGLLSDPDVLILDEPTRSLDPLAATDLRQLIKNLVHSVGNRTILLTSHNLAEIEQLCHRAAVISRGRICAIGTVDELRGMVGGAEEVRIRLQASDPVTLADAIRARLTGSVASVGPSGVEVRFGREPGDNRLHEAVRVALDAGGSITACTSEGASLELLLRHIEEASGQ